MANSFTAHQQFVSRPNDERFSTLEQLYTVVAARKEQSQVSTVRMKDIKFAPDEHFRLVLQHPSIDHPLVSTHWAFKRLCDADVLDAPANWLRRVPGGLAAQDLNWALQATPRKSMEMLWADGSQPGTARSFTTEIYDRLWDAEVVELTQEMLSQVSGNWHRPDSMTDPHGKPSGLYSGDRNMFLFLVNDDFRIDDGSDKGLARGIFVWNSEVGQMSFGISAFLYQYVCGNHIVWGYKELVSTRLPHLGNGIFKKAARKMADVVSTYLNTSTEREQQLVSAAQETTIAPTREGALDYLIDRKNRLGYSAAQADEIVSKAEMLGNDPTRLWSLLDAATRLSQETPFADKRTERDAQATRLMLPLIEKIGSPVERLPLAA